MTLALPPLYPILDTRLFPEAQPERTAWIRATVCELADAGITLLQLRAKDSSRERILRDAEAMRQAADSSVRLLLNDHAALVREAGFDGVHLGQGDMPVEEARALLGERATVGLSTHTLEEAAGGDQTSADYLAAGPVFATRSKADAQPAVGLAGVRATRAATGKPLVAIGGIGLAEAAAVWAAGADSVAVIGALFAPGRSPGTMARDFLKLFR